MSYICKTCTECGANLDPDERCDCLNEPEPRLQVSECLLIGVDISMDDIPVLQVSRRIGQTMDVVNIFNGEEAMELYKRLITNKK